MIANPAPLHPGKVLAAVYLAEMNLSQSALASKCGCAARKINEIVNGKRSITPEFAIVLEKVLGTSAEMWVRMQADYDLWLARSACGPSTTVPSSSTYGRYRPLDAGQAAFNAALLQSLAKPE
jgi:addiction module HigA family antidote